MQTRRATELVREDFASPQPTESVDDIFSDLVGCDRVVHKLREYQATIKRAQSKGQDPREFVEYNFIFAGSPGTGKTTVARRMGKMFYLLGLLPFDDVIDISASDLITGYVGQAGQKTRELFTRASGRVLFIDEAYQLNPEQGGHYMQEVVDEIVKCLTSTEFRGKLLVILAGYENDMDKMLRVNAGLRSRFSEKLPFDDFSAELVAELLQKKLIHSGLELDEEAISFLPTFAEQLRQTSEFGNGRDIESVAKKVYRCVNDDTVRVEHLTSALQSLIETKSKAQPRQSPAAELSVQSRPSAPVAFANQLPPPRPVIDLERKVAERKEEIVAPEQPPASEDNNSQFYQELQTLLDSRGLNSKQAVDELSQLPLDDPRLQELRDLLAKALNISPDDATDLLKEWQLLQSNVRAKSQEQLLEELRAKKEKRQALVPIWRCAVCGRADMPYIACYVAPFIVRYERRDIA